MKRIWIFVLLMISAAAFCADKLAWQPVYKDAVKLAVKEKKPLLLIISGSDWCPPCKRMAKTLYPDAGFIKYTKENFVLYHVDLPRKSSLPQDVLKENQKLAGKYGSGFVPEIVVVDPATEKKIGATGYPGSPKALIQELDKIKTAPAAEKKTPEKPVIFLK